MFLGITPFDIILIVGVLMLIVLIPILLRMRINSSIARYALELENMVIESKKNLVKVCVERGKPEKDPDCSFRQLYGIFHCPSSKHGSCRSYEKV